MSSNAPRLQFARYTSSDLSCQEYGAGAVGAGSPSLKDIATAGLKRQSPDAPELPSNIQPKIKKSKLKDSV